MHKLYIKFYIQRLFTLDEANKIIRNRQVCLNALNRLAKKSLVRNIKQGIYYIIPLDNPEFIPDRMHVASLMRKDAVICCNSALIVHGLWQDTSKEPIVYLGSKYAAKIRIKETTYKIIKSFSFGTTSEEYSTPYSNIELKVTDVERTIIDCLRTRSLEIPQIMDILRRKQLRLNLNHILSYLEKYKKPILYNKLGIVLESAKGNLELSEDDLSKLRKKLSKKIFYIREKSIRLIRPKYKYYQKWNCMIPETLFSNLAKKPEQNIEKNPENIPFNINK